MMMAQFKGHCLEQIDHAFAGVTQVFARRIDTGCITKPHGHEEEQVLLSSLLLAHRTHTWDQYSAAPPSVDGYPCRRVFRLTQLPNTHLCASTITTMESTSRVL